MTALPLGLIPAHHAAADPDRLALRCGATSLTRREFADAVERAARHLQASGVRAGDTVAIALPNGIAFLVTTFAAWRLDAVPFPLASHLPDAERSALLELASPALVVGDPDPRWRSLAPTALAAETDPAIDLDAPTGTHPWKLIGSGGSTGRPKLILAGVPAAADPATERYTIRGSDTVFVPGPLYHQGPFIFTTAGLITGASVVIAERFDAAEALLLLEEQQVTWTFLVPTMTHRIWRLGDEARASTDLSRLRLLFSTGAPWPTWLKQEWMAWLGSDRVLEWYGGTEEQGGLRITGDEAVAHPGAIGRADDDVRVIDAEGRDVPAGEIGELVFRTRGTGHHAYIGQPDPAGEWRGYGDLAFIDDTGYVHLTDRRTDMIVSGGVNVYPAEIEGALEAHPHVVGAVVIGLPDEDLGQYVHAVVQLAPEWEAQDPDQELRAYLRERLARVKVPRRFEFVTDQLRDDAGKVRRSAIRDARLAAREAAR
ncbi:AMP-binding protein [Nocardioides daejeonensis]|uniref:AMP-binding protein n=1 Tax=Nocardioides daejeonensis TaxID=1046556 RepID=UPI0013A5AF6E|nr:AMP-binding protein [Nocardioides daejeonensis]